jgi:hypothetical protein
MLGSCTAPVKREFSEIDVSGLTIFSELSKLAGQTHLNTALIAVLEILVVKKI